MTIINVFVVKCQDLASSLEANNVDFSGRGRKIKTDLVNVTRKEVQLICIDHFTMVGGMM